MNMSTTKLLRKIVPFLWGDDWRLRIRLVFSLAFMLVNMGINVSIPLVLRHAIKTLSLPSNWSVVALALFSYGMIWTMNQFMQPLREIVVLRIVFHGGRTLTGTLFKHLHSLSQRFHTEKSTGAIINAMERAQRAIPDLFWGLFLTMGPTIIEVFVSAAILWHMYGMIYGILLIVILLCYGGFSYLALEWSSKAQRRYNEIRKKTSSRMVDSLINFETVKYFANHEYEFKRCDTLLSQEEDAGTERFTKSETVHMGQGILIGIGLTILTLLSGKMVFAGQQSVSDFVTINSYVLQFVTPLSYFGYTLRKLRESMTDLEQVFDLLEQKPEIVDAPNAVDLWVENPSIEFDHVTFAYEPHHVVIEDVSFRVPAGSTIAFVGATGSGKSTIAKLLFRFYDVTKGAIRIDGVDIRNVTQYSLQRAIGIIPQDTVLFNDTLYENLAYARPGAPKEEVAHVVDMAQLNDLLERSANGYHTMLGERGLKISGGERQRIAIARVLLKQPAIYIFDEATSALDTKTEKEIQKNLEAISIRKTTLVIAHRLSTVVHADIIVVFDKGRIVEQGSHEELLAQNGMYARLWAQQSKVKNKKK